MTWSLTVAGTVCLDDVTTPAGRRTEQQGGSAVFAALAAAPRVPVHLVAVVGEDGVASMDAALAGTDVDRTGLVIAPGRTRRWRAVHDFERWVTATEESDEGACDDWEPSVPATAAAAEVLFLGSMAPHQQLAVLAASRARLVASDTMTVHIADDAERVWRVVEASHVVFLNRSELAALTGIAEASWREAAAGLIGRGRVRAVVVKAGPLGAAVVTADGIVEREAHPVGAVVDPTGAGDSVAGAMLAHCALAERDDAAAVVAALDAGLARAAQAIGAFGTDGLR